MMVAAIEVRRGFHGTALRLLTISWKVVPPEDASNLNGVKNKALGIAISVNTLFWDERTPPLKVLGCHLDGNETKNGHLLR